MKLAKVEVVSDEDFKYKSLFEIMGHIDDRVLFNSVMENLHHIGNSIESTKYNVSEFKKAILNLTNAYFVERKNEYVDRDRELFYNVDNNEIYFGLDWGNWSLYVEIDDIEFRNIENGFLIL